MANKNKENGVVNEVAEVVDKTVSAVMHETERTILPVRQSVLRRFPTLFLLLVTFGLTATFYGFERLILEWTYVYERPWLILLIGISILIATGTLYKKLG